MKTILAKLLPTCSVTDGVEKESLMVSKGESEAVNRRTHITMASRKMTKVQTMVCNILHRIQRMSNTNFTTGVGASEG